MQPTSFDHVSRFFATRRFSRRRALAEGGAGIVAGVLGASLPSVSVAQDVTPPAQPGASRKPEMLFLQSFQSGSIAVKEGEEGRFTMTLEQGLGQTIYFSDRPDRIVGASPTPAFLDGLGFSDENPPNAALLVEPEPGNTEIAVLELFNPRYDEATHTATYDVEVLKTYERAIEMGFAEQPSDLSQLHSTFGAAHLFIDGCTTANLQCVHPGNVGFIEVGQIPVTEFDGWCYRADENYCLPCTGPEARHDAYFYWGDVCNKRFRECYGTCRSARISLPIP
jgi:hypothetical protein